MKNLIKFEFRKLFKMKSFYICLAISMALIFLNYLTTKAIFKDNIENIPTPTGLSMLKNTIGFANLTMILAIFIALITCEDNTLGTIKNIYSKGYSRAKVYFSKYIVSLTAVLIYLLVTMLFSYILGTTTWTSGEMENNYIYAILAQIIIVIAYHALFFMVSTILKKIGASIAINIIGPTLISLFLAMTDAFLKIDKFMLSSYWLDSLLSSLKATNIANKSITTSILCGIIYSIVFVITGLFFNKKEEI